MLGPASVLRKPMDEYKNKKKVTANRPFYLVTLFLIRCPFYKLRPRKRSVLSKVPRQVHTQLCAYRMPVATGPL